jgi:hypothetical protein
MDELRTYADRRLELADMIRAALHSARGSGDEQAENEARDLLSRLAADTFRLAVVGQFSRGKTTLMNALLGGPFLPMGALPMTSVITTVRYGSRLKAIVRRRAAGLGAEVPLAQVAGYIAQASATRAEQQVVSVEAEVPAEILRLGFEFIDTPGVGSAIEINTATTRRFLPQADAVIFVTGFDSPLTLAEAGFPADAARHAVPGAQQARPGIRPRRRRSLGVRPAPAPRGSGHGRAAHLHPVRAASAGGRGPR